MLSFRRLAGRSGAHNEDRWGAELLDVDQGRHILRFGARLRGVSITDFSPQNFGGTFTSPAATRHCSTRTIRSFLMETAIPDSDHQSGTLSPHAVVSGNPNMRELGGGVTQFSIAGGNPEASVTQTDMGLFVQDEWRFVRT